MAGGRGLRRYMALSKRPRAVFAVTDEIALGFTHADLADCFREQDDQNFDQFLRVIARKTTRALRASIGLANNFAEVYT